MSKYTQAFLIYMMFIFVGQLFLKLWSLFSVKVHAYNQKNYPDTDGFEPLYFTIYFLSYFFNLGVVYISTALNSEVKYFIFLILAFNIFITILLYKKINPDLTRTVSSESVYLESKFITKVKDREKVINTNYFLNTFYQVSVIINTIITITIYLIGLLI
ncbi:MAG: hypothetical protein ACOX5X_01815 [Acholeplasmataceae bacterium]|jgi:hypothetical protein